MQTKSNSSWEVSQINKMIGGWGNDNKTIFKMLSEFWGKMSFKRYLIFYSFKYRKFYQNQIISRFLENVFLRCLNWWVLLHIPGDLRRLAVTQTPVKDHQLTLMRKTLKEEEEKEQEKKEEN